MDAPQHSGPTMSGSAAPYLSHGAADRESADRGPTERDAEAWRPDSLVLAGDPPASELARRLGEADLDVLRPGELIQFSLAAGRLAAWADGLRRAAEAQLILRMGGS